MYLWSHREKVWRVESKEERREGQHLLSKVIFRPMNYQLREVQVQAHDQRQRIGSAADDTCRTRVSVLFLGVSSHRLDTCDFGYTNVVLRLRNLTWFFSFTHIRTWNLDSKSELKCDLFLVWFMIVLWKLMD